MIAGIAGGALHVVLILLTALPPLSTEQSARLETARDGFDHREEAFFALIENLRAWDGETGDTPLRLQPDFDVIVEHPADFRGDACRIIGRIEQMRPLDPPYGIADEWFVRPEGARPALVYVVGLDPAADDRFRPGRTVEVIGRFYKRVRFTARDGEDRDYPAFVAAHPQLIRDGSAGMSILWVTAIPVGVLLLAFVLLLILVRRHGEPPMRRATCFYGALMETAARLDEAGPLPDDPAEALAELKRRAESTSTTEADPAEHADRFRPTS